MMEFYSTWKYQLSISVSRKTKCCTRGSFSALGGGGGGGYLLMRYTLTRPVWLAASEFLLSLCPTECLNHEAVRSVSKSCHSKQKCAVAVSNQTFRDPCFPGTRKYLSVIYSCGRTRCASSSFTEQAPVLHVWGFSMWEHVMCGFCFLPHSLSAGSSSEHLQFPTVSSYLLISAISFSYLPDSVTQGIIDCALRSDILVKLPVIWQSEVIRSQTEVVTWARWWFYFFLIVSIKCETMCWPCGTLQHNWTELSMMWECSSFVGSASFRGLDVLWWMVHCRPTSLFCLVSQSHSLY